MTTVPSTIFEKCTNCNNDTMYHPGDRFWCIITGLNGPNRYFGTILKCRGPRICEVKLDDGRRFPNFRIYNMNQC